VIVDFHVHILEPKMFELARDKNVFTGFGSVAPPALGRGSIMREMTIPEVQVERMEKAGIDVSVLSSSTVLQGSSWADAALDLELCRRVNDRVAEWATLYPKKFVGSFVLPLQDENASLEEMSRCVDELGMQVVQVPAHVRGRYLGEPELRTIWREISRRSLVAFMHPEGTADMWFQKFRMWNSVGQPIEEAKCIASMIYEGLLDELQDLRIVLAHGGGMLPHYMGRMDRNVSHMPDTAINISRKPSDYLKLFYFDTCLYDVAVAENLIRRVGADRLLMGSDFPVGETDPIGFINSIPGLSDSARASIKGQLTVELLGLQHR
jgi:aminocarboxymuconate-semialdehyde decarboxylase